MDEIYLFVGPAQIDRDRALAAVVPAFAKWWAAYRRMRAESRTLDEAYAWLDRYGEEHGIEERQRLEAAVDYIDIYLDGEAQDIAEAFVDRTIDLWNSNNFASDQTFRFGLDPDDPMRKIAATKLDPEADWDDLACIVQFADCVGLWEAFGFRPFSSGGN